MPGLSEDAAIFVKYSSWNYTLSSSHMRISTNGSPSTVKYAENKGKRFPYIFEISSMDTQRHSTPTSKGLSPLSVPADELLEIRRRTMKKVFRAKYSEMGGNADRLVFMENHRVSNGFNKTSFHVIGPGEKFLDVKRHGSMHNYAKRLKNMITPEILELGMNIDFHNKNRIANNMLDMTVYNQP